MGRHPLLHPGFLRTGTTALILLAVSALPALAGLQLGPEEIVQAAGEDLTVPGYSVPAFSDWNADDLPDLLVGEGGLGFPGKVRVYLNSGTRGLPAFGDFYFVQAVGGDLTVEASGCMGLFMRVVYWDADDRKDLLIGTTDGEVLLYRNTGTDAEPVFDAGVNLQVGSPAAKINIDVGIRATPICRDWDNDGRRDLVVGAFDGKIHLFLNTGTDTEPEYQTEIFAQDSGGDLTIPGYRTCPVVADLNDDGRKDLLSGNTNGQLLLYHNVGTDAAPSFAGYEEVLAAGVPIDLPGTPTSRPFLCDWTGDGLLDVLIGAGDGKVHLFSGDPLVSVASPSLQPSCGLLAPWPNPFNPRVNISFEVTAAVPVHLAVYDMRGRAVALLADQVFPAGRHHLRWEGENSNGRVLPSGVYFLRMNTQGTTRSQKLILVR
jgi:hypothetical protein